MRNYPFPFLHSLAASIVLLSSFSALADTALADTALADAANEAHEANDGIFFAAKEKTFYFANKTTYTPLQNSSTLRNQIFPELNNSTEFNLRFKLRRSDNSTFQGDVSEFLSHDGRYRLFNANGKVEKTSAPSVSFSPTSPRSPLTAQINEVYWNQNVTDAFQVTAGKKRVVWGSGITVNPGDVINPPKDPNNPNNVREGAWLSQLEWTGNNFAATVIAVPEVENDAQGIPLKMLNFTKQSENTSQQHLLTAAKMYALLLETDIIGAVFLSNRYASDKNNSTKLMASASHVFSNTLETHGEILWYQLEQQNDSNTQSRFVLGLRYMKWDDVTLSGEWYHQGNGMSRNDFRHVIQLANYSSPQLENSTSPALNSLKNAQFISQNYLIAGVNLTKVGSDDFSINVSTKNSLMDGSGVFWGQLVWSVTQALELSFVGNLSYALHKNWGVDNGTAAGEHVTENDLQPWRYQTFFQLKAFL